MLDAVNSVFKTKNLEKGVAFPTCVSVNNVVGHYSPLEGDTVTLQEGDVVKVYVFSFCKILGMLIATLVIWVFKLMDLSLWLHTLLLLPPQQMHLLLVERQTSFWLLTTLLSALTDY